MTNDDHFHLINIHINKTHHWKLREWMVTVS